MAYTWTIDKMVTEKRARAIARRLFPDDYADGSDCRNEYGRRGEPCRVCAERNAAWQDRIAQVRAAVMDAFR